MRRFLPFSNPMVCLVKDRTAKRTLAEVVPVVLRRLVARRGHADESEVDGEDVRPGRASIFRE